MVDAIVSLAVERLGYFLNQESVFLHEDVKDEVVRLQHELEGMQSYIYAAEVRQDGDERIRKWLFELGDIAYGSEDVIDTFILNVKGNGTYDIRKEIKLLTNRLSHLKEVHGNISYTLETTAPVGIFHPTEETTSYQDEEDYVIGYEDDALLLEAKLLSKEPGRTTIISILGMGGLGKTTLARKLFNSDKIKRAFDFISWISVPQERSIRNILRRILITACRGHTKDNLKEMCDEEYLEQVRDKELERYLLHYLIKRRYLVVIDDVSDTQLWESLKRALPENMYGSRIIITTRIKDVAAVDYDRPYVHKLRFLSPDESWELFYKKAFPDHNAANHFPPNFEKLGKEMVAKCDGLPLAISVLGRLLSRKKLHEWHRVNDNIWEELKSNSTHVSSLLTSSFHYLPRGLKPCFLYLGFYPENSVINAEKLMQLWIAEGFIPKSEYGGDLVEVAEHYYLKKLIGRSLIQVVKMNWRTVSTFRVHGLLRDHAFNMARDLNFLQSPDVSFISAPSSATSSYRRLAAGPQTYGSLDHSYPNLRTLLFCDIHGAGTTDWLASIHTRFRLLRVLDLEGSNFDPHGKLMLPDAVGELIHLRYLGLNDTNIVALPECIGNLQALQTLHASSHTEIKLPRELCKLKQLIHLRGHFSAPTFLYEDLTDLVSLKFVEIGGWIRKEEGKFALNSIAKLKNLRSFSVLSRTFMLSITPLLDCRHLRELRVHGRIGKLPEDMHKYLSHLMYLQLKDSGFEQDPMPSLAMFEFLIVLELQDIGVKHITCTATGFFQLEVFKLICKLDKLQMHEKAMPRLKAISIFTDVDKSYAQILPNRLASLPAVEELNWESESLY